MTTTVIPEGHIHQSDVRARGWAPKQITLHLRDVRVHDGSRDPSRSPYWYPLAEIERVEREDDPVGASLAEAERANAAREEAEREKAAAAAAAEALLVPRVAGATREGAWTREMLKESGWTDTLIKRHLGDPDFTRLTRNDRTMYLWSRDRVLAARDLFPELSKKLSAMSERRQRTAEKLESEKLEAEKRAAEKLEAEIIAGTTRTLVGEPFEIHRAVNRGARLVHRAGEIMHLLDPYVENRLAGKWFLVLRNTGVRRELDLDFDHAYDRLVEVEPTASDLADAAERQREVERQRYRYSW